MGWAVVAGKAAPIHAEHHRQILQTDVVDNLVIGPLQEGGVNRAKRLETLGGHAGGKKHRVFLGDADVEIPVGMLGLKPIQPSAIGHGPGDGHDPGILIRHLGEMVGKHFTEGGLAQGFGFTGLRVVRAQAVKLLLLHQGRLKSLPLDRHHMEDHREILGLQEFKHLDEGRDVMPVDRTVVGHPELLEDHAREDHSLHMLLRPPGHLQRLRPTQLFNEVGRPLVQVDEPGIGGDLVQVTGDRADVLVDRPFVVVENRDQPLGVMRDVVEGLIGDPAGEGRITGQTDDMLLTAPHVPGGCHAQGGRKGGARVTSAEAVVLTFASEHEAVQPAGLPDGVKPIPPAGEELVDVGLVTDIENEVIRGGVEHPVQGDRQLHHAQVRAEVSTGLTQDLNELFPDLFRQPRKILNRDLLYVLGTLDGIQQRSGHRSGLDKQVRGGSASLLSLGGGLGILQLTLLQRAIFLFG